MPDKDPTTETLNLGPRRHLGEVAVVTGSSRGFGRQIARTLAQPGARVVVADSVCADIDETADLIRAAGGHALAVEIDVAVVAAVLALANRRIHDPGAAASWQDKLGGVGHFVLQQNQAGSDSPVALGRLTLRQPNGPARSRRRCLGL